MNVVDRGVTREWLRASFAPAGGAVVAGTGHRPDKLRLPPGDPRQADGVLMDFAASVLREAAPAAVISGMAVGWDMALARASIAIGIPLVAAVPFDGQDAIWPDRVRDEYREILEAAACVVFCSDPGYAPAKFHVRNRWMVDRADFVLALSNGDRTGGTAATVAYAAKKGVETVNLWDLWSEAVEGPARAGAPASQKHQ